VAKRGLRVLLFCLGGLLFLWWQQRPDNLLHLIFCDVGQGDAILIVYKNKQLLLDGGPDNSVLQCLGEHLPFWDRRLEVVALTHPDTDHFTGLLEVVKRYQVDHFVASWFEKQKDNRFSQLVQLVRQKRIPLSLLHQQDKIKLGPVVLKVIWPPPNFPFNLEEGMNEVSLVTQLSWGKFEALLTGDLPASFAQLLAWRGKLVPVEILKASHHGSAKDNPDELYTATRPQWVIFSVGNNNFGHPSRELLKRLSLWRIKSRRTDQEGTIEIVTDGTSWWFKR